MRNRLRKFAFRVSKKSQINELLRQFDLEIRKIDQEPQKDLNELNLEEKHLKNIRVLKDRNKLAKKLPKEGYGVELGVNKGNFSKKLLEHSNPNKLILIDPWASERYGENKLKRVKDKFSKEIKNGRISIKRSYSQDALEQLDDNNLDWAYIDTTHSYEQTLEELKLCKQKVKDSGIISGHDYCQGNISKFINYGVIRAVHKFCQDHNYKIKYLTLETNGHRSFAIKKL
jgi:hypothetical protein